MNTKNSFNTLSTIKIGNKEYQYYSLKKAEEALGDLSCLPKSLKILLENLLRHEDGRTVEKEDIEAFRDWLKTKKSSHEIQYRPSRVLMQDFTGVPAVVDLAAMRDAMAKANGDTARVNPLVPVDLVIDHSVMIDYFATPDAFAKNVDLEMERNRERYEFLKWGQSAFNNFRVVPPGTGICHQVNLEYLSQVVKDRTPTEEGILFPDTVVGTDSHTPMVNGLSVLAWGVGGIEAEAALLGQPISMLIPEVVGVRLVGKLKEGVMATDLVLTITQRLRQLGVVGKFVEYFGEGLDELNLADRATLSNMAPEYGATVGFFPVDEITLDFMRLTGRSEENIVRVEAYAKAQGLWRDPEEHLAFTEILEIDLSEVEISLAGPRRPQDRVPLANLKHVFEDNAKKAGDDLGKEITVTLNGNPYQLKQGAVVLAALTSCTNTSNPAVMMAAGLVAKKAVELGISCKPWVKVSLAPGSQVVTDYLAKTGLDKYLDQLGYNLTGYGCTACIGNSGPLIPEVAEAISEGKLNVSGVLSGNRNFEGRIHPLIRSNWLASPPLVVVYSIAGTTCLDLHHEPVTYDKEGKPIYLKDLWPTSQEIAEMVQQVNGEMFKKRYAHVFEGDQRWQDIPVTKNETYKWDESSTYVRCPPYFEHISEPINKLQPIKDAYVLSYFGDSITTDHISPAGSIMPSSPAGLYLQDHGVKPKDFNSYGSRRGNHEVMMRGTFANIRIRNKLVPGVEGGYTVYHPTGEQETIYDAAMRYKKDQVPTIILAGKEYGSGSSRDWAAKGPNLQGVRAVIAESFERIHRSNLIGMGILALQYKEGSNAETLGLTGKECFTILLEDDVKPRQDIPIIAKKENGEEVRFKVLCRIDTVNEVDYFKAGGILHYVLREMLDPH